MGGISSREEVVRKHASQASGSHEVPIDESLSIVIHERSRPSKNILQKLESVDKVSVEKADDQSPRPKPQIQKVPFMLRDKEDFNKYFEPWVVSIGPLHHCNPKFEFAEKIKLKLAGQFINERGLNKEELYMEIEEEIENLRNCYSEEATKCYNDEDLAWMFFVDGCAILHYIDCVTAAQEDNGKLKELNIKNDHIAFAKQDLFLLENQLPFQVLKLLMMGSNLHSEKLRKSINKFIDDNIMSPQENREKEEHQEEEPTHLLDLLRNRLLHKPPKGSNFLARLLKKWKNQFPKPKDETTQNWYSFRTVKELKAAGIRLRPSKTSFLTDISFHRIFLLITTLKLPPLMVDDSTAPKFLNLIAYEMCPDFVNDFGVTSYVCFLDSLIDQAEDVKELRKKHILHNGLGSDEEVAKLFNQISTDLVPNPDTYGNVKDCIQNHCDKRWTTWIAQGYHDHFSSPWTFLAFAGAIFALVLSFIQAWYSMPHDDDPCDKVCCNITRIITNSST